MIGLLTVLFFGTFVGLESVALRIGEVVVLSSLGGMSGSVEDVKHGFCSKNVKLPVISYIIYK